MKRALLATLTACLCLSGCQQPQPHLPLPIPESAAIKAGNAAAGAVTSATSVARLIDASLTPATARKLRSTRPTHEAHVMPATLKRWVAASTGCGEVSVMSME